VFFLEENKNKNVKEFFLKLFVTINLEGENYIMATLFLRKINSC